MRWFLCLVLLLPALPVRAHHPVDGRRIMCPFTQHCPPGPIPGR